MKKKQTMYKHAALSGADEGWTENRQMKAGPKYNPFIRDGKTDVDAYIDFVRQFNEFINHQPKQFRQIIDRSMIL